MSTQGNTSICAIYRRSPRGCVKNPHDDTHPKASRESPCCFKTFSILLTWKSNLAILMIFGKSNHVGRMCWCCCCEKDPWEILRSWIPIHVAIVFERALTIVDGFCVDFCWIITNTWFFRTIIYVWEVLDCMIQNQRSWFRMVSDVHLENEVSGGTPGFSHVQIHPCRPSLAFVSHVGNSNPFPRCFPYVSVSQKDFPLSMMCWLYIKRYPKICICCSKTLDVARRRKNKSSPNHHELMGGLASSSPVRVGCIGLPTLLVGGLVAMNFIFPDMTWESHHPNWRSHIFQRGGKKTPTFPKRSHDFSCWSTAPPSCQSDLLVAVRSSEQSSSGRSAAAAPEIWVNLSMFW